MLAIDTNVVVRLLAKDHPEQSAKARALLERETVFVALTVILEAERVLRSVYGFEPARLVGRVAHSPGCATSWSRMRRL